MIRRNKAWLAFGFGAFLTLGNMFDAFALNARIAFSDPTTSVGSEFNVVMKVVSLDGATLGESIISLKYNTDVLDFVSGTNARESTDGIVKIIGKAGDSPTEYWYNLKFKALKAGETTINIDTWGVHDAANNMATLEHRGSSKVTISEAAAPPETSAETTAAPETTAASETTAETSAETTAETAATDAGTEAESAVEETSQSAESESTEAISADLGDGENTASEIPAGFSLAEDFDAALLPASFEKQEYNYKGMTVAAGVQADNPAKLMYLLTNDGSGSFFFYDESKDAWSKRVDFTVAAKSFTVVPITSDVVLPIGFKETTLDMNGNMVTGYIWETDTQHRYAIIYAMNAEGERNFYRYDLKERTIQRYFEDPNLRGNTVDYTDSVTHYRALQKAYESRGSKLSMAVGAAAAMFLALVGLSLKVFVLDKKNGGDGGGNKRSREDEAISPLKGEDQKTGNADTSKTDKRKPTSSNPKNKNGKNGNGNLSNDKSASGSRNLSNDKNAKGNGKKGKGKNNSKVSQAKNVADAGLLSSDSDNKKPDSPLQPGDFEDVTLLNSSEVNFVMGNEDMENLYPDTSEEEEADDLAFEIDEKMDAKKAESNLTAKDVLGVEKWSDLTKNAANYPTEDAFLFDPNVSLTVSFVDEDEMDVISDRLNRNLGIDDGIMELDQLEANLAKQYDNKVIETALDENAKRSMEDYAVPIDRHVFEKAIQSEEKMHTFSKYDTQQM